MTSTRLGSILLLVGLAGAVIATCASQKLGSNLSEEDQSARQDDAGADKNETPATVELFPETALGLQLREHMLTLALPAEQPEEADQRYAESLAVLQQSADEAVKLLEGAYHRIEPTRYFERWGLAKTLADLETPAAYGILASIARAPIPPERNEDLHHFSTQEEEIMIRLRAVEGLTLLAASGHEAADAELLSLATDSPEQNLAIQSRAIKGYLRADPNDGKARASLLQSRLPEEMHGIVTLDVTPQNEFEARVSELATISDEDTTQDAAEEGLPDDAAPAAQHPTGGQNNEQ